MWQYIWDKSSHVSSHPFSAAYLGHGRSSLSRRAKTSLSPSSSSSGKTGGVAEPKERYNHSSMFCICLGADPVLMGHPTYDAPRRDLCQIPEPLLVAINEGLNVDQPVDRQICYYTRLASPQQIDTGVWRIIPKIDHINNSAGIDIGSIQS